MSKAKALSLARRLYGRDSKVRTVKGAPVGAERKRILAEHRATVARLNAVKSMVGRHREERHVADLVGAAQFVVDVKGDCPSIDQLAEAVQKVRVDRERADEIARLKKQASRLLIYHRRRCEVVNVLKGFLYVLEEQGDTWPEVCDKLQAKLAERKAVTA